MKAFFAFVVFGVVFAVCMAAIAPEQRHEFEQKLIDECKGPSHANEDEIKSLQNHEVPQTHNGKCLLACIQEKLGILVDGKLSVEGAKAIGAKKHEGNPKNTALFYEMVDECQTVADPDRCEAATKFMGCMVNAAVKRGVDPKEGLKD
ncbi:general odorant-binding protein 19d-like [Contarinia nasturtii]|uniref:general odorant-binding protein 19d-like n=1 Tax=Contarinia nasturtii TaxID=265458 RepID=UPI0012D406DD|nr:general odorant-binding protein 19d-like [Contarinia nasturtii]